MDNSKSHKYLFYSVLAVSIASVLIVAMLAVININNKQANTSSIDEKNNITSKDISRSQNNVSTSDGMGSIGSSKELAPTFAYTINKSKGELELICQVKKIYGCDLYSNNDNNKVLIKKYNEAIIEYTESENTKNVKWVFNLSSWNYGGAVLLIATDEKGINMIEGSPVSMANIVSPSGE